MAIFSRKQSIKKLRHYFFYWLRLRPIYKKLLRHQLCKDYLSAKGVRVDGDRLDQAATYKIGEVGLTGQQFAHLFWIFNESRAHIQMESMPSVDLAPPGQYLTTINPHIIQHPHKNRIGIYQNDGDGDADLYLGSLHIDHIFLRRMNRPPLLGVVAFALCAITAYLAGLKSITLLAGGGKGYMSIYVGYKVWPRLGFDAELLPGEVSSDARFSECKTIQGVRSIDAQWWETNGSQRLMRFDLAPSSISWKIMLAYLCDEL